MLVLGLDTATFTASVAVVDVATGTTIVAGEVETDTHSDVLLTLIDRLLADAGLAPARLDAIAVGAGPGSFTGLRIGLATGKGLAFALGRPLWLASSLGALALDAGLEGVVCAALDARRGEIYAGCYRAGVAVGPERVLPPTDLAGMIGAGVVVVGDALAVHAEALAGFPGRRDLRATPSAASVARLAAAGDRVDHLERGVPVYIRPSEAEVKYPDGVPGAARVR